jgi:hypothetical protein
MNVKQKYMRPATGLLIVMILGGTACKKSFYTDVNSNPNVPTSASITPTVLLPSIEAALGYLQGGDLSRFASLNLQQDSGAGRQAQAFYQYNNTSTDVDNLWGNIYADVLDNAQVMVQLSDAKGFHAYSGVGRILQAYTLQTAVDVWGAMPYSQALKGATNLQPAFDTDKGLYDTVAHLVDAGIAQLNNADPGALTPGDEDVIYKGKASQWIKFGHAIKARLFIHQSKGNPAMAANALNEMAQSFTSNKDNAQYIFGNTETTANPWYQFNEQRTDISFSSGNVAKMMIQLHDPRLPILIDTVAADGGDGLLYYGVIDAPVEFISYDEQLLAAAEMILRNGGSIAAAQAFYQGGINANMAKLGVKDTDIGTYLTANGILPTSVDAAIAKIATQVYLALYLNPEAWTTWRRTNAPALTPFTGSGVPRRLLYPQTEYSYNKSHVPASVTVLSPKIFWDN